MTDDSGHWRDARLKKALDSAPDADARPSDGVREAILDKARLTAAATRAPGPGRPPPGAHRRWGWHWWQGLATAGALVFVVLIGGNQYVEPYRPPAPQPAGEADLRAAASAAAAASSMALALADETQAVQRQREAREDAKAQRQRLETARQRVARAPQAAEPVPALPVAPPVVVAQAPVAAPPAPRPAAAPPAAPPPPAPSPAPPPVATAAAPAAPAPAPVAVADAGPLRWTALRIAGTTVQREQLSAGAVAALDRLLAGEPQAMRLSEKRAALRSGDGGASAAVAPPLPPLQVELLAAGQPPRPLAIPSQETQLRLELQRAAPASAP